jgi:hypothetical protein
MSTIPSTNPVDDLIKQNRALTPRSMAEVRKQPRHSISELNELSIDDIRDRYIRNGFDDRSPVTKVLDLIDLPRNAVANIIFRGTGAVGDDGLRRGAAGLPVVTVSDALKSLGVKNHLVRGVVGFVGDVATDPLTFLGPAGWGFQAASKSGRAVGIGARGAKALRRSIKEVGSGAVPSDQFARSVYESLLANAPDEVKAGDAAARASYFSKKALGEIGAETKAGTPFYYVSRALGGDAKSRGGAIADDLTTEGPVGDAVRGFVGQYGTAAGPGIGKGGSQIAHIPFTEKSAKVKGFTRAGRAAEEDLSIARSAAPRAAEEIATPTILRAGVLAKEIANVQEAGGDADELVKELATLVEQTEASPIAPQNPREIFALQKFIDEAEAGMEAARAKRGAHQQAMSGTEEVDDMVDELDDDALENLSSSAQDTFRAYQRYKGSVTGAVRNFAQNTPQDEALLRSAMRFLGTDDRIVGRASFAGPNAMLRKINAEDIDSRLYRLKTTVFGEKGTQLAEANRALRHAAGPGSRRNVNTYIGNVTDELRKAFTDAGVKPTGDDLDEAATLLMAMLVKEQAVRGGAKIGSGVYYTNKFGTDKPAAYLQHIQNAINSGKFNPKLNNGLYQRLEQIAATHGADLIEELGDIEKKAGLLQSLRAGMVPNVPTPAAQAAIKSSGKYGKSGAAVQSAQREAFQKARSMDQVRWVGADGVEKRLFRAELDQARRFAKNKPLLDALVKEGRGDVAAELQKLVDNWKEYDAIPDADKPAFRNTDPFEMEELRREGYFSMLLDGIDPVGGFMQTNMIAAMSHRIGSHERAMARAEWAGYVDKFGMKMPDFKGAKWSKTGPSDTLTAPDGSQAKIVTAYDSRGAPVKAAEIGGQVYRPVQGLNPHNPLAEMLGPDSAQTIYHEQVASAIERTARLFDDPNVLLEGINALTRQWKNITLLHPSWTIFNLVGDSLNALQGGANVKHFFNPEYAKFASKITRYASNPEKLRSLTLNINGQTVTGEQLLNDLVQQKVVDGTMMEDTALKMVENKIFTLPSRQGFPLGKDALTSDFKDAAQRYAAARSSDTVSRGDKFKATGYVASDRYLNNFLGPWFRFNQKVSNYVRTQTYISFLADGYSPGAAARKVVESQFDYSDATRIEADVFRTLFPFYSWMRNNGAYQIKRLLDRPAYTAAFPKVQQAIEESIAGDEKVPQQLRPNWMRAALALQIGNDPEKRSALLFGSGLPIADVYQYLTPLLGTEGAMSFAHYFGSGINPVLNVPLQLASGQETFSGRTIGADPYSGDVSAGEFLRSQIRPIAEVGKIGRAYREGGITQAAGRAVLGGRVQDFSEERLTSTKLREFNDKERRIRAAINRAERTGAKERSLAGRVKLLELYSAMVEAGLENEVPKWALPQLEQMSG